MNKFVKVLSSVALVFAVTGCASSAYTRTVNNSYVETDVIEVDNKIDNLVDNVKYKMNQTNALKGTYTLENTKTNYKVDFSAITKEKRLNWDLYATTNLDGKDISAYLKDTKLYLIYPNNGANVILKDSMQNVVTETETTLKNLNATYNEDNLENLLTGDKLEGFDFDLMKEKATFEYSLESNLYTITLENAGLTWQYDIDATSYLIMETRCQAINFNSKLVFKYPEELTITYPMGLDFLTMNIKEVKNVLEIDSFSEIIDGSVSVDK